jgi:hypothetical protein
MAADMSASCSCDQAQPQQSNVVMCQSVGMAGGVEGGGCRMCACVGGGWGGGGVFVVLPARSLACCPLSDRQFGFVVL